MSGEPFPLDHRTFLLLLHLSPPVFGLPLGYLVFGIVAGLEVLDPGVRDWHLFAGLFLVQINLCCYHGPIAYNMR